jgi:hypothetical protein
MGRIPVVGPEWTNQLATLDTQELKPLLDDLEQLKAEGLTGAMVAISFCRRLIQPLQDRGHMAFEYLGQSDSTRVAHHKVSKAEMIARAKSIFGGRIRNKECPKALGIYSPADPVNFRPWPFFNLKFFEYTSWFLCNVYVFLCSIAKASTGARHRCVMKTSAATKSATWRTRRQCHLLLSMSTSPTRRWD